MVDLEEFEQYDDDEEFDEPTPCDDCDDRTMPVAMRRCDECSSGSWIMKNKLKCNCDHELTDEEDYRHDMWGCPNVF